jgi:hypothetical protein
MKFQAIALLSIAAAVSADVDIHRILASADPVSCDTCFELIDDARDCLRECNNEEYFNFFLNDFDGTVLNECLDPNRADRPLGTIVPGVVPGSIDNVESIDDLVDCCKDGLEAAGEEWDETCDQIFVDVQECLGNCFDGCLAARSEAWFRCVQDTSDTEKNPDEVTGNKGCSRQSCINGFVDEDVDENDTFEGNALDFTLDEEFQDSQFVPDGPKSEDQSIFDVQNIAGIFEDITEADMQDCALLDNFITSACRVGDTCCRDCNTELASTLDCLLNTIVSPFVSLAANMTEPVFCAVPEDCRVKRQRRELNTEAIAALAAKGQFLPQGEMVSFFEKRRLDGTAAISDDVQFCMDAMNRDVVVHNMTYAANKYMECASAAALSQLQDEVAPAEDSAATAFSMLALVAAVAVALF